MTESTVGSQAFDAAKARLTALNGLTPDRFDGNLSEVDMGLEHPRPGLTFQFDPTRRDIGTAPPMVRVVLMNAQGYDANQKLSVEVSLDKSSGLRGFRLEISPRIPDPNRFSFTFSEGFPDETAAVIVVDAENNPRVYSDPELIPDSADFGAVRGKHTLAKHLKSSDTMTQIIGWVVDCIERRMRPEVAPETVV